MFKLSITFPIQVLQMSKLARRKLMKIIKFKFNSNHLNLFHLRTWPHILQSHRLDSSYDGWQKYPRRPQNLKWSGTSLLIKCSNPLS